MMAGDKNGVFFEWKPAPGTYTVDVTPYLDTEGRGTAGPTATITVTVVSTPQVARSIAACPAA